MASATHSRVHLFDHFVGAALAGEIAGVAENSGTAAVKVGIEGGACEITTGTSDGNRAHLSAGLNWRADRGGLYFEARVKNVTAVTTRALFIGLTDTVAQENPIELGASQAITSTATDAVGFVFDTGATTDVWYLAGVNTDVDATLVTLAYPGAASVAPAADTWDVFGISVNKDGDAEFFYNGIYVGRISEAVSPDVLLTPHVGIETRTTAAATAYVDYIEMDGAAA